MGSFTADGQLQSQSWPDGSRQDFAWEKGRLKQISLPDQSRIALGAYQWLMPGQIELPAGARITQKPDAFQRLAQLQVTGAKPQGAGASAAQLLQRRYSRNPAGHITRIESEEGASAYTYDRLGRLTQAEPDQALQDKGLPNEAYSWDAAGNRLSSAHQAGAWTYNEANQLLQYPRVLDENAPAQQSQTEQVSARVTDHLGAPVLALNKAGETTWKARYEAFGKARIDNASTAQINLRLPGQYFDAETGLHQNWNRDYAPGIGRYVQADPIGLAGGLNVYQYAYGQPLSYFDDTGEFVFIPALLGGGIAAFTDLGFQLLMNRGDWNCINWMQVGLSGMAGAIGGAWVGGAFRHSVSNLNWFRASHRWGAVRARYGKVYNLPKGKDVHHWLIQRKSILYKKFPGLVNHPWNLNPNIPNSINIGKFNRLSWPRLVLEGSPGWARATAGYAGAGILGEIIDNECGCN